MSTRSVIGIRENDEIKYIYCHFDGYYTEHGVGWKLNGNYQDPKEIESLMKLGDISSLEITIADTTEYAYGEPPNHPVKCPEEITVENFPEVEQVLHKLYSEYGADYVYIYDKQWYCYDGSKLEVLSDLVKE